MFSTLQEYHQAIISAAWMITLSLIPQDLVRAGAILFGFLIYLQTYRPRILIKTLQLRLSSLEVNLQDAVDSGIMRQSNASFTNQFVRDMGRMRYMSLELYERTLMTSGGIFQEIMAVCDGLSLKINECPLVSPILHDAQINRAKILKNQYHLWCDRPN
ncbi:uncharacterized protein LACBIDRAFT_333743 [Laccaria bicolor S238N-H82]|uniref:Predicted protein n=1 Tax=Laccaria bicolor (strain S238N-H82 / ATCC MYA-4686) TaxID=486041 RepID=B0DWX7_LACBS|nr:uncharacterized protein LACBIDRAFT_333743 [Laccaria bicolor S238N-H82]EDR00837.1 predicted protein [Laccaria bicolor S238N-H82]|eukprot:XP_001888431.1 predicted protein [Laccaria bicolor S238N-H82]